MTMTISGDSGLTFPDSSKLATELGIFNRIIDGGFIINQRGYTSGTSLSSGSYAHDRWKAGSGGCTYTFTQGSLGVNTTITITSGTLQQVIEGCNVPEGGTYTLSWTGTATARINSGSYSASPLTVTGITAGANTTIEFATGTVNNVQFETGSYPSNFAYRPYGTELALCQRYFQRNVFDNDSYPFSAGYAYANNTMAGYLPLAVAMRATPTATIVVNMCIRGSGLTNQNLSSLGTIYQGLQGVSSVLFCNPTTSGTSLTSASTYVLCNQGGQSGFTLSAEL